MKVKRILVGGAAALLVGTAGGLLPMAPASAQTPAPVVMPVFLPRYNGPVIASTGFNAIISIDGVLYNTTTPVSRTYGQVSGTYCSDTSGGQVFVPSGSPVPADLSCSANGGG